MFIFLETVQRCLGISAAAQTEPEVVLTVSPQNSAGEQKLPALPQWIAGLCQATGGLVVMLLDPSGAILAQAGDWPLTAIDRSPAIAALLAACKAGIRASDDLIAKPAQMFSYFATARGDLFLALAGEVGFLLLITPPAGENLQVDRIYKTIQPALKDLPAVLRNAGMPVAGALVEAGADVLNEADNAPLEKEVAVSQEISEALDAVFNRAAEQHFEPEVVDAFWESIAKDVVGSTDSGALSYEEAMRLGLAPDEH